MSFLKLLEGLRTPFFDTVFQWITAFGEETLFMVVAMIFFWCVDKKRGYYLLLVGTFGGVVNQFLKLVFRIPRPWVKDAGFTIVESARAGATGYSFPSGHTQTVTGTFGGVARFAKNTWVRVGCIAIVVLTAFSRMYLGVHTPLDVGVSLLIGTALVFLLYPVVERGWTEKKGLLYGVLLACIMVAATLVVYAETAALPTDPAEAEVFQHGIKTAYQLLGTLLAMTAVKRLDDRYIRFDTKAAWWMQILKVCIGLGIVIAVRTALKTPLLLLTGGHASAHGIRYFLMTLTGGAAWPACFRFLTRLQTHRKKEPLSA